jgi:hypothetical protein
MKKLIAAVVASAFAFGAATSFAGDVQARPVPQHSVKAHKAHQAHKAHKKVHSVQKVQAPKMHQVKMAKKHHQKRVRKAAR